jgi:hypothetical protein
MCITKEEVHKILAQELEKLRPELREDMYVVAQSVVKDYVSHERPSPQTMKELQDINRWISSHEEVSRTFSRALFGDTNTKEPGLVAMVRDVHEKILSFNGVKGLFQWILLTGGVLGILWTLFKRV